MFAVISTAASLKPHTTQQNTSKWAKRRHSERRKRAITHCTQLHHVSASNQANFLATFFPHRPRIILGRQPHRTSIDWERNARQLWRVQTVYAGLFGCLGYPTDGSRHSILARVFPSGRTNQIRTHGWTFCCFSTTPLSRPPSVVRLFRLSKLPSYCHRQ